MGKRGLSGKTYRIPWSQTRHNAFNTCLRQGAYKYFLGVDYMINPPIALGLLYHARLEENMWYSRDYKVKKRRGQPRFDQYESGEDFGRKTFGTWKSRVRLHNLGQGRFQRVAWRDKNEPYWLEKEIISTAAALWDYFSKWERPLELEYNLPRTVIEGVIFTGKPDILIPGELIDLKSMRWPTSKSKLKHNVQFTVYTSILSLMCATEKHREFAEKFLLGNLEEVIQNPLNGFKFIKNKQIWVPTGFKEEGEERIVTELEAPNREPTQLINLIQNIWDLEERIHQGVYPPNEGPHCDWCFFRDRCAKDTANQVETRFPIQHDFLKQIRASKPKKIDPNQIKFQFPKPGETKEEFQPEQIQLKLL